MDVTTIVTAGVAGMSGVGGGYLGMRQQLQTVREQVRAERQRDREKREDERQDRRFDMRLETYHRFLDIERRLRRLLASRRTFSESEYGKWSGEFTELYHLVALIGTERVRALAERLLTLFRLMESERMSLGDQSFAENLTIAFQQYETKLEETRIELIAAMRLDVAAPEPPPAKQAGKLRARAPASLPPPERSAPVIRDIAIVSEVDTITVEELERVVAAVQEQISRDLAPTWNVDARLAVYETIEDAPADAFLVAIRAKLEVEGMLAMHTLVNGRLFGIVQAGEEWTLHLSHTCLEMLVSPQGDRNASGISPKPGQRLVQFLVQVCDPCASSQSGYEINGVLVSDFCTRHFYDAGQAEQAELDHTGQIKAPRRVAPGGYLSWYDPDSATCGKSSTRKTDPRTQTSATTRTLRKGSTLCAPQEWATSA